MNRQHVVGFVAGIMVTAALAVAAAKQSTSVQSAGVPKYAVSAAASQNMQGRFLTSAWVIDTEQKLAWLCRAGESGSASCEKAELP